MKNATIYASDSIIMTKIDKLCTQNPNMYSVIESDVYHWRYRVPDKFSATFRTKKREITDK